MESFSADRSLYEMGAGDLKEIWDSDFDAPMNETFGSDPEWSSLLDQQPVILNDRMITEAMQSPKIQTEHSYSLTANNDQDQDEDMTDDIVITHDKYKVDYVKDYFDTECFPAIPMSMASTTTPSETVTIKQEPLSDTESNSPMPSPSSSPAIADHDSARRNHGHPHSILKQPTIVLATKANYHHHHHHHHHLQQQQQLSPKVSVKVEPVHSGFHLPPTPPSSNTSDSEGSLSPVYTQQPSSPPSLMPYGQQPLHATRKSNNRLLVSGSSSSSSSSSCSSSSSSCSSAKSGSGSPLISNQPKGATGILMLTEEEKRTLLTEGYPIPTRLPLTKAEEKSLKKIRRKIKNKISAQESRRKKKEYMDALEKKVETLANENCEYKRKLDSLETNNRTLMMQLQKLQSVCGDVPHKMSRTVFTQTATLVRTVEDLREQCGVASNLNTRAPSNFTRGCVSCQRELTQSWASRDCGSHNETSRVKFVTTGACHVLRPRFGTIVHDAKQLKNANVMSKAVATLPSLPSTLFGDAAQEKHPVTAGSNLLGVRWLPKTPREFTRDYVHIDAELGKKVHILPSTASDHHRKTSSGLHKIRSSSVHTEQTKIADKTSLR